MIVVGVVKNKAVILKRLSDSKLLTKSISVDRLKLGTPREDTRLWMALNGPFNDEESQSRNYLIKKKRSRKQASHWKMIK